ncbi:MAG: hypothetical protein KJP00_06340 [Bacteroidia bacterium]|nr:hypothetical protein [Bacteroidia bacterium]
MITGGGNFYRFLYKSWKVFVSKGIEPRYMVLYNRKILLPLLFITGILLFGGCSKDEDLVGVQMPYIADIFVPAGLNPLNTHYFEVNGLVTNAGALLGQNDINKIIPLEARMSTLDNVSFAFVREVEVFISDTSNPNLDINVFYREEIPPNTGSEIRMIATQAEITDILKKDRFNFTIRFELFNTTDRSFDARIEFAFLAN